MQQAAPSVRDLFIAAVELESPAARSAFLDRHCGDAELRRRIEEMLAVDAQGSDFLEVPAAMATVTVALEPRTRVEEPGTAIGPYKLLEQIGEGGMGDVYVAEQSEPVRRRVALKLIKPGMDSKQVVARFEVERQALAMMDHPNIAKVHDAGMTPAGRPYFVMELVRGLPITEYCDEHQLTIPERLELFVLVCRAVQHAHQKGVIHRDLKPSNVLVTVIDGVGVPKVIDFGVAKATGQALTDKTVYTGFHQFVGTPLYTSPEQAELSGVDVDTRSDIYSLGVLLYELLTGATPFDSETLKRAAFDEMRRIIREEEPPKPSTRLGSLGDELSTVSARRKADPRRLGSSMKRELDWVVMKALEKDRRRRYETANDFAADVTRYLADQPVQACPPSAGYRLRKLARRNRGAVAAGLALVAILVLGTVGTSIGLVWALRAEEKATEEKERAIAAETKAKQAEAKAKEEAAIASAVRQFLTDDLLAQAAPERNTPNKERNVRNRTVTVEELLSRAAARIAGKFAHQPRIEAEIRQTIGRAYQDLGDLTAAQLHLERAAEIGRSVLGEDDPATLFYQNNLAVLYSEQGKWAQAEELWVKVLETGRRVHGTTDFNMLLVAGNLAKAYRMNMHFDRAIPLVEDMARLTRDKLGSDHPHTLEAMVLLGEIYRDGGRLQEGTDLLEQARAKALKQPGSPNHDPRISSALAFAYQQAGQLAKAESLHREALEAVRQRDKETSSLSIRLQALLAENLLKQRRYTEAEPLLRECLEFREQHASDEPRTFITKALLGGSLLGQKEYDEAEKLLLSGYEGMKQRETSIPQEGKVYLTEAVERMVQLYEATGQTGKADEWREKLPAAKSAKRPESKKD